MRVAFLFHAFLLANRLCQLLTSSNVQKETEMLDTTLIPCLRKHGQLMDDEIAAKTGVPLDEVRELMNGASGLGTVASCSVTRYLKGEPVEGFMYRIAGYRPPATPGRKPAQKTQVD